MFLKHEKVQYGVCAILDLLLLLALDHPVQQFLNSNICLDVSLNIIRLKI